MPLVGFRASCTGCLRPRPSQRRMSGSSHFRPEGEPAVAGMVLSTGDYVQCRVTRTD